MKSERVLITEALVESIKILLEPHDFHTKREVVAALHEWSLAQAMKRSDLIWPSESIYD